MEAAEARFKGDEPGFIYSRFSNPTVAMFEQRMCLLEGAEAARATASGMAAVTASLLAQLKAGDHVVVGARAVRLLPLCRRGSAAALGRRLDARRRRRPRHNGKPPSGPKRSSSSSKARPIPGLRSMTSQAIADIAHEAGAKLVVDNVFATPLLQKPFALRRRRRRLFGDQAHRRPRPVSRRGHSGLAGAHRREHPQFPAPDRAGHVAVQRLGDAERAGDLAAARRAADARARPRSPTFWPSRQASAACSIPFRADHPQADLARRR